MSRVKLAVTRGALAVLLLSSLPGCGSGGGKGLPPPPAPVCTPPVPQSSSLAEYAGSFHQRLELGTHKVNETVTFPVPSNVQSVTILEQQANADAAQTISLPWSSTAPNTPFPHSIYANGTQIFDVYNDAINPGTPETLRVYYFTTAAWTGALTIPNTAPMLQTVTGSPGGVPSGTWSLVVSDFANECPGIQGCSTVYAYPPSEYDITVLLKEGATPGPVSASGTMDVALYLATESLTASSAQASPDVQKMLSFYGGLLGAAGIAIGNVTYHDLDATLKAKYATINGDDATPCGDLAELLSHSVAGNQMNLFLVDAITSSSTGSATLVGLDGTIPGPASLGGTVQSGAAVSVSSLGKESLSGACSASPPDYYHCGNAEVAYIAAHETGHFLGLYHPTESDGTWFDPLAGTPQCACSSCGPSGAQCQNASGSVASPYAMTGYDCTRSTSCGGGDYLMFWVISAYSKGSLSSDEGQVMRANPLVQ